MSPRRALSCCSVGFWPTEYNTSNDLGSRAADPFFASRSRRPDPLKLRRALACRLGLSTLLFAMDAQSGPPRLQFGAESPPRFGVPKNSFRRVTRPGRSSRPPTAACDRFRLSLHALGHHGARAGWSGRARRLRGKAHTRGIGPAFDASMSACGGGRDA